MESGISLIRDILPVCSKSDRKIATFFLTHPEVEISCIISELGQQSGRSVPAIVRLYTRAGIPGYREFKCC